MSSSGVLRGEQSARLLAALDEAAVVTAPGLFVAEVANALYAVLARRHGAAVLTLDARLSGLLAQMGIPVAGSIPE